MVGFTNIFRPNRDKVGPKQTRRTTPRTLSSKIHSLLSNQIPSRSSHTREVRRLVSSALKVIAQAKTKFKKKVLKTINWLLITISSMLSLKSIQMKIKMKVWNENRLDHNEHVLMLKGKLRQLSDQSSGAARLPWSVRKEVRRHAGPAYLIKLNSYLINYKVKNWLI